MEKWRSKGKSLPKEGSILPPTRRSSGQNCLPLEKKKDRKWSFGGLLRRISLGQNNEASSNEEDITYIPGHMLAKKQTKKISKMRSKIGKMPRNKNNEGKPVIMEHDYHSVEDDKIMESIESSNATIDQSRDSLYGVYNDSINLQSSDGSLDASGKNSRIGRMKARAKAKRDRLRIDSSSDDDSHKSSQSSMKFRSEDSFSQQRIIQRVDSCNRKTRGARTERYIKRISRDDCSGSSDGKPQKPPNSSCGQVSLEFLAFQPDSNVRKTLDSSRISSPGGSSSGIVRLHGSVDDDKNHPMFNQRHYDSRLSDVLVHDHGRTEKRDCEKFTWPKTNFRRTNPGNEIQGSLRPRQINVEEKSENNKILPPEPPPRSSKSRIFTNLSNAPFSFNNHPVTQPSDQRYYQHREMANIRSYNSDNEIFHSNYWSDMKNSPVKLSTDSVSRCENENFNSLDRMQRRPIIANRSRQLYHAEQTNNDADYFSNKILPSNNQARTTCSLPKGVELFSRQKLANCSDNNVEYKVPQSTTFNGSKLTNHPVPRQRFHRESSQSPESKNTFDANEAQRRRSSKNLQEALFELEAIYNSLRLSDPDLLERAEQRTMDEYRDKAAKTDAEYSLKNCSDMSFNNNPEFCPSSQTDTNLRISDDMAYRRMHPKERPSSVNGQSSVSQISYLATSPNLSIRDNDSIHQRSKRSSPDLTRDDLLYRNISHAINTLKVIEPQPPFGIPLGPVTGATESDYLHVKPTATKYKQTRSLYIPKSEPDVVSDDLAFRNLRKDKDNWIGTNKNTNIYMQMDSLIEPHSMMKVDTSSRGTKNKRAVRSNSSDLITRDTDWYNDYVRSTQKLRFSTDDKDHLNNDHITNSMRFIETSDVHNHRNNSDLDINGNRPKSALQQKIQSYVPREILSCDNDRCLSDLDSMLPNNSRDPRKSTATESEDSSPARCCESHDSSMSDFHHGDNENKIEQFTEQEISEYKKLCQDLEKLIRQTADEESERKQEIGDTDVTREENNSQSEIDEWEKMFNDDYDVPDSILNFNDGLENPDTEGDDDRCSLPSIGLSSENSETLPKNRIDKPRDQDLFSSSGELGICGNSGSVPDSVSEKFDLLLKEVDDTPLAEFMNKIGKYPIDDVTAIPKDLSGSESNIQRVLLSVTNDGKSKINDEKSVRVFENSARVPEHKKNVVSKSTLKVDQDLTKNLEDLKSPTRRMRNEEKNHKTLEMSREKRARAGRQTDDNGIVSYEEGLNNGTGNLAKQADKLQFDNSLSSNFEADMRSDKEIASKKINNKFNQLLREVSDVPLVECTNKIGMYPVVEHATTTKSTINSIIDHDSANFENIKDHGESTRSQGEISACPENASQIQHGKAEFVTSKKYLREQYSMENLKRLKGLTRRAKNEEENYEIYRTMDEGKAGPKLHEDTETFACREGEKRREDEAACNDDACAFKDISVHKYEYVSHVTNSITICDIVLCSFFLTLLITILFAQ